MGLIQNIFRYSSIPITSFGGTTMSHEFTNFNRQENWILIYTGEGEVNQKSSLPRWNSSPVAWRLPLKAGEISALYKLEGINTFVGSGALGAPTQSTLAGVGTISNAEASLLASLLATIINEGTFSGNIVGGLSALCEITGLGTVVSDLTDGITRVNIVSTIDGVSSINFAITGGKDAVCTINGTSNLTASLGALAGMIIEITSGGQLSNALVIAKAAIEANITPFTELSPENLAANVWNAIATEYNTAGTMGNKLNLASSGGVDYQALSEAVREEMDLNSTQLHDIRTVTVNKVTKVGEVITIYELDGVTVWKQFDLTDDQRIEV